MKDISNIKANFSTEIIIGFAACLIAVFIIVKSLQGLNGWTGLEQEMEKFTPATQFNIQNNNVRQAGFVLAAAPQAATAALNPKKIKPGKEFTRFGITGDMFLEGHWWGMELENLTPIARQILKIPSKIKGLWIDETNLWAVRSGIYAADILLKVNGFPVRDLTEFYYVTKHLRNRKKVILELLRGDRKLTVRLSPGPPLGIAAMESGEGVDPLTSDAPIDPLDMVEGAPKSFPKRGYKALVAPAGK